MALNRFWFSQTTQKDTGLPFMSIWYFGYRVFRAGWYAGYGRYSKEELMTIGRKDLDALNTLIGSKKYLFSDTNPCDADFSIFGVCAQFFHTDSGPLNLYLRSII